MKKKRKLKKEVMAVLLILAFFVTAALVLLIINERRVFHYEEALNENVIIIGDTTINLKEFTYYIIKMERDVDEKARLYNESNPLAYWNMYMNNVNETGYVTDLAKNATVDYCIRDNVYFLEATAAGFELPQEIKDEIKYDAQSFFDHMSAREKEVSGLMPEDLELIIYKETVAYYYMAFLVENDKDGIMNAVVLKYDVGGSEYNFIRGKYIIEENRDIIEKIRMGFVTIN